MIWYLHFTEVRSCAGRVSGRRTALRFFFCQRLVVKNVRWMSYFVHKM